MCYPNKQFGMSLILSLVMLLMMSIIGIGAMKNSVVEEKMSGNSQSRELAFQSAESALRAGENWLLSQSVPPMVQSSCTSPNPCVLLENTSQNVEDNDDSWWVNTGTALTTTFTGVAQNPIYVIDYIGFVPDTINVGGGAPTGVHYYRISAIGYGSFSTVRTILQSTSAMRY